MLKQTASISVTHLGIFWLFNPQQRQIATIFTLIRAGASDYGFQHFLLQESPAIADKPERCESLPKIAPIRRAYNVVADNTGLSSCV